MSSTNGTSIPNRTDQALCGCGCGEPAPVATRNDRKRGYITGQPKRFVRGHHARLDNPMNGKRHGDVAKAKIRASWTDERRAAASTAQTERMRDPAHTARMNATYLANQVNPEAWITPNEAEAFLIQATTAGPTPIRPTRHQAAEAGHSIEDIKRARLTLGLTTVTIDGKRCWARPVERPGSESNGGQDAPR